MARLMIPGSQWQVGRKRYTKRRVAFYVEGVSWGEGDQIEKYRATVNASKAATFRTATAMSLAVQLVRYFRVPVAVVQ